MGLPMRPHCPADASAGPRNTATSPASCRCGCPASGAATCPRAAARCTFSRSLDPTDGRARPPTLARRLLPACTANARSTGHPALCSTLPRAEVQAGSAHSALSGEAGAPEFVAVSTAAVPRRPCRGVPGIGREAKRAGPGEPAHWGFVLAYE